MKPLEVKAVYTVPELGALMGGMCRHRVARMLRRMGVPVLAGRPRLVLIADLKALAPAIWASLEEAAHLRALGRS